MRFGVIAAKQRRSPEHKSVPAMDDREVVREFITAQDGDAGKENTGSQIIDEPGNLQSDLAGFVGDDIKAVVIPLHSKFILSVWIELVIPRSLQRTVIRMSRTARREGSQRLHIRRLFQIMSVPVSKRKLIPEVEVMIEPAGSEILSCVVRKDPALRFKLIYQEPIRSLLKRGQPLPRNNRQSSLQQTSAERRWYIHSL